MEYLGFWVTHNFIKATEKNIGNKNMTPPTSQKNTSVYSFSQIISQYVGKTPTYIITFN